MGASLSRDAPALFSFRSSDKQLEVRLRPGKMKEQTEGAFRRGVSKRALRALASIGVTRLDQVTRFTEAELLALHGMGPKAIGIIKAALLARENHFPKPSSPHRT